MKFENCSAENLRAVWENEKEAHIEIGDDILGFSGLNDDYFSTPKEVPPTPIAFFKDNFVKLIYHSSDDLKGRWMRFVLFVYATGGKILFTKRFEGLYDAHVVWSHPKV